MSQSGRCQQVSRIRGFAIVQTTRDDIYAMQSQLWDRQSEVGIEPLTFELDVEEPNPLAITAWVSFDLPTTTEYVL